MPNECPIWVLFPSLLLLYAPSLSTLPSSLFPHSLSPYSSPVCTSGLAQFELIICKMKYLVELKVQTFSPVMCSKDQRMELVPQSTTVTKERPFRSSVTIPEPKQQVTQSGLPGMRMYLHELVCVSFNFVFFLMSK